MMRMTAFLLMTFVITAASAQEDPALFPQKPTTGYAPVSGLKMYYEVHGSGEPVVLLSRFRCAPFPFGGI